jgi:hypothetical protein
MTDSKKITARILQQVLLNSKRKCCICFAEGQTETVLGEVAHLSPGPSTEDNLVFLCVHHHMEFDQSAFSPSHVKQLRNEMLEELGRVIEKGEDQTPEDYERHVFQVIEKAIKTSVRGDCTVLPAAILMGQSGCPRQIDILLEFGILGIPLRLVGEIRRSEAPINAGQIDEFSAVIRDVSAQKGLFITSGMFSHAAINVAQSQGISLMRIGQRSHKIQKVC